MAARPPWNAANPIAAFTSGAADVLLATDAGAEGLNLHTNCRVVVNLELPWNPIRLEQRIGRVDRIGQTRTVHAMNLLAAGTAEDGVLARLQQRLECMRMSEIEVAACVINRSEPVPRQSQEAACTTVIDMREAAKAEARRLSEARTIEPSPAALPEWVVPVTVLHRRGRRHVPGALPPGVIAFMRTRLVTGAGRLIEDTLVPVRVPLSTSMRRARRREIRAATDAFIATAHPHLVRVAREHALRRAESITLESAASGTGTIARAHGIAHRAAACRAPLVQAGLFDTRAVRQHSLNMQRHEAIRGEGHARARLIDADSRVRLSHDPEMVLILVLC